MSIRSSLLSAPRRFSGGLILNVLGFHILRILLFKIIYPDQRLDSPEGRDLRNNGIVILENYLGQDEFERIKTSCENAAFEIVNPSCPKVERALFTSNIDTILGVPSGAHFERISYAQEDLGKQSTDERSDLLHFDVSYPTYKWFFYLTDTTKENGAFTYVPTSNRMTIARMALEYVMSVKFYLKSKKAREEETPAVSEEFCRRNGMELVSMEAKANTLIIANTGGFHRRGEFSTTTPRFLILASYRGQQSMKPVLKRLVGGW